MLFKDSTTTRGPSTGELPILDYIWIYVYDFLFLFLFEAKFGTCAFVIINMFY